jgi:hypothetical protein
MFPAPGVSTVSGDGTVTIDAKGPWFGLNVPREMN